MIVKIQFYVYHYIYIYMVEYVEWIVFKYRDFLKSSDDYIFTNKSNFVRIYFLGNLLSLTALIFFILYPEATLFSRMIVDVY